MKLLMVPFIPNITLRHEDIYEKIILKLRRIDEIKDIREVETDVRLNGISTILCTVSMLSNPGLVQLGFFRYIPVQRLVIDEASQIYVGQYIVSPSCRLTSLSHRLMPRSQALLHKFAKDLRQITFFGDPNQLPPFGSDDVEGIDSIFEKKHLKAGALFLDTQCT